ncbi:MAG: hypothetical protein KDK36_13840, partial [Leptospiraceae bacterium]|nr:hypothetical protein [Leptospiraceae bacterium]
KNKNLTNAIHFYRKALEHSDSVYLSLGRLEKIYNRLGLKERNEMLKIKMKKLRGKYEKN